MPDALVKCRCFVVLMATYVSGVPLNCQTSSTGQPVQVSVQSSVLSEERRILIRLPRSYELDTAARYPVLYKFDGDNRLQHYGDTIEILNNLDLMPELIVVAIPNGRGLRNRDLTPPSLHQNGGENGTAGTGEMGRGDRFLDFIEQDLIPYVENNYRTTKERILAGHSRAALLVLYSLLSKPELFHARFMFSAPLTRDEARLLADTRAFFKKRLQQNSFLYCNWGESENEGMHRSYNAMKVLLASEAPKSLRWTIERARAADHQRTPIMAFPAALHEYFARDSRFRPPSKNRRGQIRSGSPVQAVRDR